MKDDAIYDVASQAPIMVEALQCCARRITALRAPRAARIVEVVKRGVARPHSQVPKFENG